MFFHILKINNVIDWFKIIFALTLIGFLQACSNTRFGQDLANSFESTNEEQMENSNLNIVPNKKPSNLQDINKKASAFSAKRFRENNFTVLEQVKPKPKKKPKPISPHPYRITIKISQADPSAPAEAVTRALRSAGVSFEVEMIERLHTGQSMNNINRRGGLKR